MKTVAIIGAFPPPSGGNSVHIQRLCEAFADKGYNCVVFDLFASEPIEHENPNITIERASGNKIQLVLTLIKRLRTLNPDILHMHVSSMNNFAYVSQFFIKSVSKSCRIILTVHSGSFIKNYLSFGIVKQKFIKHLINCCHDIIAVGEEQADFIKQSLLSTTKTKVSIIPAYLPPKASSTANTQSIIEKLDPTKKILINSGYGVPLYGYEKLINAYSESENIQKNYQIVICLYNTYEEEYLTETFKDKEKLGIIIAKNLNANEFAHILQKADIYVRTTDRDGDAVAIREANYYGLSVIATDVIKRPEFCLLFSREDKKSLIEALNKAIKEREEKPIKHHQKNNPLELIEKIYNS